MIKIWLIRHGKTEGNKYGRYIGVTDEPLCPDGQEFLSKLDYPEPDRVYISPMKRCIQTAQILFPKKSLQIIEELAECDFGEFENKNYKELDGNANYQAWIDSNGTLPFPGGESREEFKRRNLRGFERAIAGCIRGGISQAAFVIHGGTIMSILEKVGIPKRSYYDFQTGNGEGYRLEGEDGSYQYEKICYTQ